MVRWPHQLGQLLGTSKVDGAIIVTTPQEVALLDVRKVPPNPTPN